MFKQMMPIFLLACGGGYLFYLLNLPLPWTLGPLATSTLWVLISRRPVFWPRQIRNYSLAVLGFVMGSPFTPAIAAHIAQQLPIMLAVTIILIIISITSGYIVGRSLGIGTANSIIGSLPGGLSQMTAVCEEIPNADPAVVTLMQTVRVVTVVFTVPFLTLHGLADQIYTAERLGDAFTPTMLPTLIGFAAAIIVTVAIYERCKWPSPYLIAPLLATAVVVLSGIPAPPLPTWVIAGAQICIGIHMGIDLARGNNDNWKRIMLTNLLTVLAIIGCLLGIAYLFAQLYPISLLTAFISMAPGGMSEMALTAMMVHADLPTVVAYQVFRLLFLLTVCIPIIRYFLTPRCGR